MKNIQESFLYTRSIRDCINGSEQIDEGLKDWIKSIKNKFKQAFEYLKGVVVKVGSYFLPVGKDGEVLSAISPLTAGQAYADGLINPNNTCIVLDKAGAKIVGLKTKPSDAEKMYGSGNSIDYWRRGLKECEEIRDINSESENINEVKLQNSDPQAKYNVIVDDDMLKKRIKMALKNDKLARLMIWGAPGIGKTAILMNVLDEMRSEFPDYRLIMKTLSNETPDNFTLPTYVDTDTGKKADDVPKTWLPVYKPSGDPALDLEADAACGKGLLFIDELSRATPQVLNVVLPLVNEGLFNGYKLGSGWTIVVASNRADDELSGQADIGNALANRFAQVYYEPTVKTWRKWADKQKYMSPLLLQWLSMPESENMSGGKFYYMDPNEDLDDGVVTKLMCTPRAWTNAMRELACYSHTGDLEGFTIFDIPREILAMTLNQYVPADAIDSFLAFLDVIGKIGDFDRAVYDIWQNGGKGFKIDKKDLNKITLPIAQLVCSAHADKLPTEKEFENLSDWLVSMGSDQLASYVLDIFKTIFMGEIDDTLRNGAFVIGAKVKQWGADNPKLSIYNSSYDKFFKYWGISLEKMPDYMIGLRKVSAKFGASFKAAQVDDHVDALG